jgi:hypothetical protein
MAEDRDSGAAAGVLAVEVLAVGASAAEAAAVLRAAAEDPVDNAAPAMRDAAK